MPLSMAHIVNVILSIITIDKGLIRFLTPFVYSALNDCNELWENETSDTIMSIIPIILSKINLWKLLSDASENMYLEQQERERIEIFEPFGSCPICFGAIKSENEFSCGSCNQKIHEGCVKKQLFNGVDKTCPFCRAHRARCCSEFFVAEIVCKTGYMNFSHDKWGQIVSQETRNAYSVVEQNFELFVSIGDNIPLAKATIASLLDALPNAS